ncbi:hypothetical protein [Massilia sp. WF1]|uniref:hypothetical protein n=1 Tax=Massilia sp. WF1 TaxID=1406431 RepID=UPI0012E1A359|nr:hypothetical protein [Massilia sp. WF1]
MLDVTEEAQLNLGNQEKPAEIVTHEKAAGKEKDLADAFRKATLKKRENAEFTSLQPAVPTSLLLPLLRQSYLKSRCVRREL